MGYSKQCLVFFFFKEKIRIILFTVDDLFPKNYLVGLQVGKNSCQQGQLPEFDPRHSHMMGERTNSSKLPVVLWPPQNAMPQGHVSVHAYTYWQDLKNAKKKKKPKQTLRVICDIMSSFFLCITWQWQCSKTFHKEIVLNHHLHTYSIHYI